jgi:hypothetical protein
MHLADENNKLSQQRKISPTALVYRCEALAGRKPARCSLRIVGDWGGGECGGTARRDKARASQVTAVAVKTIYVSKGGIGGQIIAPVHCPSQRGSRHALGDPTICPDIKSKKALPLASVVCLVSSGCESGRRAGPLGVVRTPRKKMVH